MSTVASSSNVLDVASLVSQLMSLERKPIEKLTAKIDSYQTKISSFGTISGLVSSFQSALQTLNTSLEAYSATPSDANIFSASATSLASTGTYSLEVSKLAKSQNLAAAGQISDTTSIATGASTVTFTVGTTSTNITVAAGATLQDIRTAINNANMGVTANIVNDGSGTPYRLTLTANNTGVSNSITSIAIQPGGDNAINDLLSYNDAVNPPAAPTLTQTAAAQDAQFIINGVSITKSSNIITDVIQGVTLTLKNTTTTPASLTVARDTSAVVKAATGVVDTYNAMANQLKSRSAFGTATTPGGALAGDGTIRLMQQQLRGILGSPATPASGGSLTMLAQAGITYQTDGTLRLDSGKLVTEMANNFSDVNNLFSSATGFATRLKTWSTSVLAADGAIAMRTDSINKSITNYNSEIDRLEIRMTVLRKQYTTTYSNLNMVLSSMNSTSAYLSSQFAKGASS